MPSVDSISRRPFARLVALVTSAAVAVVTLGLSVGVTAPTASAAVLPNDPATVTADALPTWQLNGVVWSQVTVGDTVYVTGSFSKARPPGVAVGGPGEIDAGNLFAYDITTGNPVPFNHTLNGQGMVIRANPDGSRIYVGGDFTTADGQVRQHIAAFDTATGALVADFQPRTDGQVRGFGFVGNTVYVGGNFRSANGQARRLLAAFNASNGAMLPWAPTVDDGYVWAMVTSPDGSRVILGGSFTTLNGVSAYGSGAVNAATGATEAWAANARLRAAGNNGAISSLSTDGTQIYGSGYSFGAGAQFEGTFGADPNTGEIIWVNDCLGDTYDIFAIDGVAYNVSHRHECLNIGGFPDTVPRSRWIKASADRTTPIGTIAKKNAYGWDMSGLPYSGSLHWYPDLEFGTYTSSRQAAWSVTGNSDYVALGGEFPKVNGVAQQGLVRFVKRPQGPHASKPINNTAFAPAVSSTESGKVKLAFSSVWDRDDTNLTYDVYRSPGTKIATFSRNDSEFWSLPMLGHTDVNQTPGASVRYQVRATDPDGNFQWSAWSPYVTVSGAAASPYVAKVRQDGATHYWRLSEPAGATVAMDDVANLHGTNTSTTLGTAGAATGDTAATTTAASKITTNDVVNSDPAVTVEAWVKTTSIRGGRIVGFGDSATGTSASGQTDRVLYLDNTGRANFAINDGTYRTVYSRYAINDGNWHHVVGAVDGGGMQLFVDGVRVGRDQNFTTPKAYAGYWRIGTDQTTSFANRPTDAGLVGSIDEVAVYPKVLTKAEIQGHYTVSGRSASWTTAPGDGYGAEVAGDSPDLYWRLGEASGAALDSSSSGQIGNVTGTVTRNQVGPITGNRAMGLDGTSGLVVANQAWNSPKAYSAELWFKTTSINGGKLIGFGNAPSGLSASYDRHVTMQSNGKLAFGVSSGGLQSLVTSGSYNDGQWHHLVATQGADGMRLWVDTQLVGSNAVARAANYLGHWRVGGDKTWGSTTSNYIAGTLDEVAVYPRQLAEQDVRDHFTASGRQANNRPPTAAFSPTIDKLKLTADGSASSDPDGPVTYAWNFGDGTSGTGATPSHTYAAAGTYQVTLTVTDALGLTNAVTKPVTAVVNQVPVAAFTVANEHLEVSVDAAGSTDADGEISSYAWNFGDETNGTGASKTHAYEQAGTYTVSLTVTDDDGATHSVTHEVTVTEPPNQAPEAAFTSGIDGLELSVDGSGSDDPDGSIASYAWYFGDGENGTGATTTHTYAESGEYEVTLTVTDDDGATDVSTKTVTARVNQAPEAAFAHEVQDLQVSVDASGSDDADGSVETYAWEFGDGETETGATVSHTYDEAGSYDVKLTVTDNEGATDTVTKSVTVTAPTVYATDEFDRSVGTGWGSADRGGNWSIPSGSSKHSVAGGTGRVLLAAGAGTTASLPSVSSDETEMQISVSLDKASTGGGQYVSVIGRSVAGQGDYRVKARVNASGTVSMWLVKMIGSTETVLTSTTVPGLTYAAGQELHLKLQVAGQNSTSLKSKAWLGSDSEPAGWTLTTTDSTSALQAPGSVGIYSFISGSTTNGPVAFSYDDLRVGLPE